MPPDFTGPHSEGIYSIVFDNAESWIYERKINYTRALSRSEVVYYQAEAVYNYLRDLEISYVNTPVSFYENAQSIKYPHEVLETKSGNCIDLTVLFASMYEALSMEPCIYIVPNPGHAFVGVKAWSNSNIYYPIETTMVSPNNFAEAWERGKLNIEIYNNGKIFDIKQYRDAGITPAPIN